MLLKDCIRAALNLSDADGSLMLSKYDEQVSSDANMVKMMNTRPKEDSELMAEAAIDVLMIARDENSDIRREINAVGKPTFGTYEFRIDSRIERTKQKYLLHQLSDIWAEEINDNERHFEGTESLIRAMVEAVQRVVYQHMSESQIDDIQEELAEISPEIVRKSNLDYEKARTNAVMRYLSDRSFRYGDTAAMKKLMAMLEDKKSRMEGGATQRADTYAESQRDMESLQQDSSYQKVNDSIKALNALLNPEIADVSDAKAYIKNYPYKFEGAPKRALISIAQIAGFDEPQKIAKKQLLEDIFHWNKTGEIPTNKEKPGQALKDALDEALGRDTSLDEKPTKLQRLEKQLDDLDKKRLDKISKGRTRGAGAGGFNRDVENIKHQMDLKQIEIDELKKKESVSSYGSDNTLVTKDSYADIQRKIREKLGRLNAGIDPELIALGTQAAVYHIEAGARTFAKFTAAMVGDFGESIKPYLRGWYEAARYYPGADQTGMTSPRAIDLFIESGEENATGKPENMESNSGVTTASQSVGGANVSDESATSDPYLGTPINQDERSGLREEGDTSLPDSLAPLPGTDGNLDLFESDGTVRASQGFAGSNDRSGSGTTDAGRVPVDRLTDKQVKDDAESTESTHTSLRNDQRLAGDLPVKLNDKRNIDDTLPVLFPEQRDDVAFAEKRFFADGKKGVLFTNGTGTGKLQPLSSKILTPDGWALMGDIVAGSMVIGVDGKPTKVLKTHPTDNAEIFTVKFSDGSSTECCDDHLWLTQTLYERRKESAHRLSNLDTPLWDCAKPKVRKLSEIRESIEENHYIPMVSPVQLNEVSLVIPAYSMGVMLGDGNFHDSITISNPDEEIKKNLINESIDGVSDYKVGEGKCPTYRIKGRKWFKYLQKEGLAEKLSYQKHVPDIYLNGSIKQRLDILQGLLDTDGTVDKDSGNAVFCSTSMLLTESVIQLVQSFGGTASLSIKKEPSYTYKGEKRIGRPAMILWINLPDGINPFKLSRKANLYRANKKYLPRRYIVSIHKKGFEAAQCLTIDHPEHLYVTDDYIVTHNTYTGLGIAKRFYQRGKKRILILVPTDAKVKDWIEDGRNVDLPISQLVDTSDEGQNVVSTTYANFRDNFAVADTEWDLIIYDESHYLNSNKAGDVTAAQIRHREISNHEKGYRSRAESTVPEYREAVGKLKELRDAEKAALKAFKKDGMVPYRAKRASKEQFADDIEKTLEVLDSARELVKAKEEFWRAKPDNVKVVLLSATPFAYDKSIDYAEGLLFKYNNVEPSSAYNVGDAREQFFIEHFGYRMRYNKLTEPEAEVNRDLMERQFHKWLRDNGALSGRQLSVDNDYSRQFIDVQSGIGNEIDRGYQLLTEYDPDLTVTDRDGNSHTGNDVYPKLKKRIQKKFDYHYTMRLLEATKTKGAIERAKQHIALGRKVVVFHSYKTGEPDHPFIFDKWTDEDLVKIKGAYPKEVYQSALDVNAEIDRFNTENQDLIDLDLNGLKNPTILFPQEFGDRVTMFNGDIPKKARRAGLKEFNRDGSGVDVFLVNIEAGKEGLSAHDITGVHQRVMMQIALPVKPVDSIQTEGRTFRLGVKSNAVFEYLKVGTSREAYVFGTTISQRSRTAENLALGDSARDMERAFIEGYLDSSSELPSEKQGKGGKAADARNITESAFDSAISFYYGNQKRTSKNKAAEGKDYFATPEPLGQKMVEWANVKPNEKILEPSAGHGAISRWFPEENRVMAVEPSGELFGRLSMHTRGNLINGRFEDVDLHNKFDAVVMNPPFGTGGKLAMEHIAKAFKHLRNGGRIVAIIPMGNSMSKRLDKWMESKDAKFATLASETLLPSETFKRAGTAVNARVVIIDKYTNPDEAPAGSFYSIDLSSYNNINDFFDAIRNHDVPDRGEVKEIETEETEEQEAARINGDTLDAKITEVSQVEGAGAAGAELVAGVHTKKGHNIWTIKMNDRVDRETFVKLRDEAKKLKGRYSSYKGNGALPGFIFTNEEQAKKFMEVFEDGDTMNSIKRPRKTGQEVIDSSRREFLKDSALVMGFAAVSGGGFAGKVYGNNVVTGKAKPVPSEVFDAPLSDEVREILIGNGGLNTDGAQRIKRALDILGNDSNEYISDLSNKISDLMPVASMNLRVDTKTKSNSHGSVSLTERPTLTLYTADGSTGLDVGTFMHESLHAIVLARYRSLSISMARSNDKVLGIQIPGAADALAQLKAVWKEFESMAKSDSFEDGSQLKLSVKQARTTPDEFFVRALTDPIFQEYLASKKYEGKTLLERFIDWVKTSLFGFIREGNEASWLDAALLSSHELLDAMGMDAADYKTLQSVIRVRGNRGKSSSNERMNSEKAVIDTPAFKKWFGDSKVVDASGRPKVVYHGSPDARGLFNGRFKTRKEFYGETDNNRAYHFSDSRSVARSYADDSRAFDFQNADNAVGKLYLSINNPLVIDAKGKSWSEMGATTSQENAIEEARNAGHDGIIIKNTIDDYGVNDTKGSNIYIAFEPGQIKSAEDSPVRIIHSNEEMEGSGANKGTFDRSNPNIRYQRGKSGIGMRVSQVQKIVDKVQREYKGTQAAKIIVRKDDMDAFSEKVTGKAVKGGYDPKTNTIVILANAMDNEADVLKTIRHEVFVHYGLRQKMNEAEMQEWLDLVRSARGTDAEISEVYESVIKAYPNLITEPYALAEEVVARVSERYPKATLLDKIRALMSRFFRRLGIDSGITTAEINAMIDSSAENLRDRLENPRFEQAEEMAAAGNPVFYSQMLTVLEKKLPGKGQVGQFKMMINNMANNGDFKAEELQWSGVNEWLDSQDGKITKNQVLDFINANTIEIIEVKKGVPDDSQIELFMNDEAGEGFTRQEAINYLAADGEAENQTKFEGHTLPGGENYTELLLTLPKKDIKVTENGSPIPEKLNNYNSPHYSEPNILAHVRYNERVDADGKKVLFLEELQSDWHQAGRKDGYLHKNPTQQQAKDYFQIEDHDWDELNNEERESYVDEINQGLSHITGVPAAPFKTTWPLLIMKRMIRHAAENGFDSIAWTTGDQQNERYKLSNKISQIVYHESSEILSAYKVPENEHAYNGGLAFNKYEVKPADLPEIIGDELSKKILLQPDDDTLGRQLKGLDLEIGGEGMRGFYDNMLPKMVNKYVKKWGSKVGNSEIETDTDYDKTTRIVTGKDVSTDLTTVHSLNITDKMASAAISGQFMFQRSDDDYESARRKVGVKGRGLTLKERYEEVKGTLGVRFRQGVIDRYASLAKLDDTVWKLARGTHHIAGAVEAAFKYGKIFLDEDGALDIDTKGKGLAEMLSPLGHEIDDFMFWMIGNRSNNLMQEGREHLFNTDEIASFMSRNEGTMSRGRDRKTVYEKARKDLMDFQQSILDIGIATDAISKEEADTWNKEFYIPFYRVLEDKDGSDRLRGAQTLDGLTGQTAIKRLKGGTKNLNDPLANILMNWHHVLSASMKNQAATAIVLEGSEAGILEPVNAKPRSYKEGDPHAKAMKSDKAFFVRVNGKKEWFDIKNDVENPVVPPELVLEALTMMNQPIWNNAGMKALRGFKRVFTIGVTAAPEFRIANLLRDTMHSVAVGKQNYNMLDNVYQGWKGTKEGTDIEKRMMAGGGTIHFGLQYGDDPEAARMLIEEHIEAETILTDEHGMKKYRHALKGMWIKWRDFGNRIENVNRASLYKKRIDEGASHFDASHEARDLLDFFQGGSWPAVRFLTQTVPFLNARLQGLDKMFRAGMDDTQKKQAAIVIGTYVAATLAMYLAYRDDEDFKSREEWDRDSYHWFKAGDTAFRIPKPFEVGAIGTIAERALEFAIDDDVHGDLFAERLGHVFWQTFEFDPVPQAARPLLNIYANKDPFTKRPIESLGMQNMSPSERRYTYTSETAIGMSKAFEAIGWDKVNLSPIQIEYMVKGYLGWAGSFTLGAIDNLVSRPIYEKELPFVGDSRPDREYDEWPITRRFVQSLPVKRTKYTTMFYENMHEINTIYADMANYRKLGELVKVREIVSENRNKLALRKLYASASKKITAIGNQMRRVRGNDNLTGKQKQDELRRLRLLKNAITERIIKRTQDRLRD